MASASSERQASNAGLDATPRELHTNQAQAREEEALMPEGRLARTRQAYEGHQYADWLIPARLEVLASSGPLMPTPESLAWFDEAKARHSDPLEPTHDAPWGV